jgi:hypothetical protein
MEEERKMYKVLLGKREGKRPLGRTSRRWDDGIILYLRVSGWGVWSGLTSLTLAILLGLL